MWGKVAVLQVLLVALVTASSPHKFLMDIEEQGWEFTESVTVDEEANTERIEVPHHNQVAATTFIHDFNKNVTLRIIEETGNCYLTDLADMIDRGHLVNPKEMKKNLKAAQLSARRNRRESEDSEVVVVLQEWTFGEVVSDDEKQDLSEEMRQACSGRDIRWLHRLRDRASVRGNNAHERSQESPNEVLSRQRRQVYELSCAPTNIRYRCKLKLVSGQYVYETCGLGTRGHRRVGLCTRHFHIVDEVKCCRYCCNDRATSDYLLPYCETYGVLNCP